MPEACQLSISSDIAPRDQSGRSFTKPREFAHLTIASAVKPGYLSNLHQIGRLIFNPI